MANLTNCTTVIILDEMTPRFFIESALACVSEEYEHQEMPVLIYPVAYVEKNFIPVEKLYTLCIMNLQYTDLFLKFCDELFHPLKNSPESDMTFDAREAFHV
jgi:hypothetical protein